MNENYRELNDENLEQVNGGLTRGGARMAEIRPGRRGRIVTADNRFDVLTKYTTLELRQMDPQNPLYALANEYLMLIDGKTTQHLDNCDSFPM